METISDSHWVFLSLPTVLHHFQVFKKISEIFKGLASKVLEWTKSAVQIYCKIAWHFKEKKIWQRATSSLVLLQRRKVDGKSKTWKWANVDFQFCWKWWTNSALCFGSKPVENVASFLEGPSFLSWIFYSPKPLEGPEVHLNLAWLGVLENTIWKASAELSHIQVLLFPTQLLCRVNTITRK